MNEDKIFKIKDALFIRNIALSLAILFSISFAMLHIGLTLAVNECEIRNYTNCNIELIPLDGILIFFAYWIMTSIVFTSFIMIFLWKHYDDMFPIFTNIPNLEN